MLAVDDAFTVGSRETETVHSKTDVQYLPHVTCAKGILHSNQRHLIDQHLFNNTLRYQTHTHTDTNGQTVTEHTRCFIKRPLFVFFIIYSNDDQFTQNLYQLQPKKILIQNIATKYGS